MKTRLSLFLAACVLVVLPACGQSPSGLPTLVINQPKGGEIIEQGTPMTVSWTCSGCEAIIGAHGVVVYASGPTRVDATRSLRTPIGVGGPTDSFVWTAGQPVGDGPTLPLGAYRIVLQTFPKDAQSLTTTSEPFMIVVF